MEFQLHIIIIATHYFNPTKTADRMEQNVPSCSILSPGGGGGLASCSMLRFPFVDFSSQNNNSEISFEFVGICWNGGCLLLEDIYSSDGSTMLNPPSVLGCTYFISSGRNSSWITVSVSLPCLNPRKKSVFWARPSIQGNLTGP